MLILLLIQILDLPSIQKLFSPMNKSNTLNIVLQFNCCIGHGRKKMLRDLSH